MQAVSSLGYELSHDQGRQLDVSLLIMNLCYTVIAKIKIAGVMGLWFREHDRLKVTRCGVF